MALQRSLNARAQLQALQVALAMERCRFKHGQRPDKLEALVPEFPPEIPDDPFDLPNPLKLVRTPVGVTIYSVGSNLVDNGGDSYDDIVVPLFDASQRGLR